MGYVRAGRRSPLSAFKYGIRGQWRAATTTDLGSISGAELFTPVGQSLMHRLSSTWTHVSVRNLPRTGPE